MTGQLKVSFCITCHGRLHHLKETLPENLKRNADYPNVEFVILDYDSRDGLEAWVKENFRDEIHSGKICYAKHAPAEFFHTAHAKNMAHRVATGDIVCNLDADNITGEGFARWLSQEFSKNPNGYTRPDKHILARRALTHGKLLHPGMGGRIAMSRSNFMRLHGYNERIRGWGQEDGNLIHRARSEGMKQIYFPFHVLGDTIAHSNEERLLHLSPDDRIIGQANIERRAGFIQRMLHPNGVYRGIAEPANQWGNFGCGEVTINFGTQPQTLEPRIWVHGNPYDLDRRLGSHTR